MADFSGLTLTAKGAILQNKVQLGEELVFTRVAIGDGELSPGDNLAEFEALINEKQSVAIFSMEIVGSDVKITAAFNNSELLAAYNVRELGIFANDPDDGEILYAIANAGNETDYMPAYGGSQVVEQIFEVTLVDNPLNTSAVFNQDIYVARSGDTMMGPLILAGDPSVELEAASKRYVDAKAIMLGKKVGLQIYYVDSDDIRIRPGIADVNGIIINKNLETQLSGEFELTGWHFVTIDNQGTIQLKAATGPSTSRPTDTCYSFSNYDHVKQGYYYNTSERIIGAIYRVSATTWYIINNYETHNEQGQNVYGYWNIYGNVIDQYGMQVINCSISETAGPLYSSSEQIITFPIPFYDVPVFSANGNTSSGNYSFWINMSHAAPTTTSATVFLVRHLSDSTKNRNIYFRAEGQIPLFI